MKYQKMSMLFTTITHFTKLIGDKGVVTILVASSIELEKYDEKEFLQEYFTIAVPIVKSLYT